MKRSYLFRKPTDDEDLLNPEIVHAKPIEPKFLKKLGNYAAGKDFVRGTQKSQEELDGGSSTNSSSAKQSSNRHLLSKDERNKISAKILRAELKGDMYLANKLKAKLENGLADSDCIPSSASENTVLLLQTNETSGLTIPFTATKMQHASKKTKYKPGYLESKYQSKMDIEEMKKEEIITTASDQLEVFERSALASGCSKIDDDWQVDDMLLSQNCRKKSLEKEENRRHDNAVKAHQNHAKVLEKCNFCHDSKYFNKFAVVAVGFKTYLMTSPWLSLTKGHCLIVPLHHYISTTYLDEDIDLEMNLWRKGLVAMWRDQNMECVFLETAKNLRSSGVHMYIECIPVPANVSDMIKIYFKKAIDECENEWTNNKKLISLNEKNSVKKVIPKGMSYFSVNFGLETGFAHVIENQNLFPFNFGYEVIGGLLDLDARLWRKKESIKGSEMKINCDTLKELWEPYDWTMKINK